MNRLRRISYEEQQHLLGELWVLLSNIPELTTELRQLGYLSFLAWSEFEQLCCESDDDRNRLALYQDERSKGFFVRPDGFLGHEYSSYLDTLRPWGKRFDGTNTIDGLDLEKKEQWRMSRFLNYREKEINHRVASKMQISNDSIEVATFFSEALRTEFLPLGFEFDEKRSFKDFPVVVKPLCGSWDLCWAAKSVRQSRGYARVLVDSSQSWFIIEPTLYLANRKFFGEPINKIGFKESYFMVIRLGQLVNGLDWAYSKVQDFSQVSLCTSVYANLYSIVGALLEKYLIRQLE